MITMLLGGLWHGAALNFVLWGLYHGTLLVVSHRFGTVFRGKFLSTLICFHLVLVGWLFFRVDSMNAIILFARQVIYGWSFPVHASGLFLAVLGLACMDHLLSPRVLFRIRQQLSANLPAPMLGLGYAVTLLILLASSVDTPAFLYFQF